MKKLSPYLVIALSYLLILLIGTILLYLPISQGYPNALSFTDAFFVSTSAVTITGITPVANLASALSPFGKFILTVLIQIGGLSVVTISAFIMYILGIKIGITNRVLIKENFNQNSLSGMVKLVRRVVVFTFAVELLGFLINLIIFIPKYNHINAIGISFFHAVSAFNNAGFDLFGIQGAIQYDSNLLFNINTCLLIMIGGTGFIVIYDIFEKKSYKKLSIHSKIVITMNLILWICGTIFIKLSQYNHENKFTWLESFFLSVSSRTAGFTTVDLTKLSTVTIFIIIILMFIGASPASTGGGIKTTTIYTLFKNVTSYAKGKQVVTHNRLISAQTRQKASVLLSMALTIIVMATLLLLCFENLSLDVALFEIVSCFSNVGLSKISIGDFSVISKLLLCLVMFIGRVGPLTIISLFNKNWYKKDLQHIEYIEEKIMIG